MRTTHKIQITLGFILLGWFILFTRPNVELDITRHIQVYAVINLVAMVKVHFWLRKIA